MKISTLVLLSFLSIPVSAQLTLNGIQLLSSPGTYSGDIAIPPDATLSVTGGGTYTLSGVISNGVAQRPTLLPMTSDTGADYLGGRVRVTASSAYNGDYQGWKCISYSPSGVWITRSADEVFELQVEYEVPVIITSARLCFWSNDSGSVDCWGIEGSVGGTSWRGLYGSGNARLDYSSTTVSWENTTAYTHYRFSGLSSNDWESRFNPWDRDSFYQRNQEPPPGLRFFQLLGDRTPTPSNLTVQAGSGKIVLTGANTYSGSTTIASGTLVLTNPEGYKTTSLTVNGGATLEYDATSQGGSASTDGYFLFNSVNSATTGEGTVNIKGVGGKFYGFGRGGGRMTFNMNANAQINIQGGSWQWGWAHGSFANNLGNLDIAAGAELRNSDTAMQCDKLTGGGVLGNAFFHNTLVLTVGVNGGTSTFAGTLIDGGNYNGVTCSSLTLIKQGTGQIILGGANTYSGTTTITNGTLVLTNPEGYKTTSLTVNGGATLEYDATSQGGSASTDGYFLFNSVNSATTGEGTVNIKGVGGKFYGFGRGGGRMTFNMNANAQINIQGGSWQWGWAHGSFANNLGNLDIAAGAELRNSDTAMQCDKLTGGGVLGNAFFHNTLVLTVGVNGGTSTFAGTLIDGGNYNGVTCSSLTLIKQGTGQIILGGANTYSGTTTITNGTLVLTNPEGYKTTSLTVNGGATLEYDATSQGGSASTDGYFLFNSVNSATTGEGTVNIKGVGGKFYGFGRGGGRMTFNMNANAQINIQGGSWQWGWAHGSFASNLGNLDIAVGSELRNSDTAMQCDKLTGGGVLANAYHNNPLVLTVGVNGGTSTFSGTLIDGGNYGGVTCSSLTLIKQGIGQIILSGANTYSGTTTITSGTLVLTNPEGYKTTSLTVNGGATLEYDATSQGGNVSTGAYFLFNSVYAATTGAGTVNIKGVNGKFYGFGGSGQMTFNMNAHAQINIQGGSWQWGWAHGSFASNLGNLDIAVGSELRNSDTAMQCDKLTGGGVLANAYHNNPLVLTVGVNGGTSTFSGTLIDGGNYGGVTCSSLTLIKQGTGQLILSGANTYTGGTTINGGTLKAGHLTAPGTGSVAINSGTILDLRGGFGGIANTLTNNGGRILRDEGLFLNGEQLTSDAGVPYSNPIELTQNSTFTQVGTGTYTLSGVISGAYGITSNTGAGNTLRLTGANTYSGTTTITSGTLVLTNPEGYKTTSLTVNGGATLEYDATSQGGNVSTGAYFLFNSVYAATTGAGTVNIRGANGKFYGFGRGGGRMTFNMSTNAQINIQGGSWQWGWAHGSFASNLGNLDIAVGSELRNSDTAMQCDKLTGGGVLANAYHNNPLVLTVGVNGGTSTFSGTLIDGGNYGGVTCSSLTLIKQGIGQIILSGANTYSGTTTITSGTLVLTNPEGYKTTSLTVNGGATLEYDATSQGGNVSTGAYFLFNSVYAATTGAGTVNIKGVNGKFYGFGGSGQMTFNMNAHAQINIQGGSWQWGWAHGSFASNLGNLDIAVGSELRNSDTAMQCDKLTGGGVLANAYHNNPLVLTVGVNGGTSTFSGTLIDGGNYGGVTCSSLTLIKQGTGQIILSGANTYSGTTTITSGTLVLTNPEGYKTTSLTVNGGATLEYDATSQGGSASTDGYFLFNSVNSATTGEGTVNIKGVGGKFYGFGRGGGRMTFNMNANAQINIQGGSWQWGWGHGSFANNLGNLDIAAGAELRNSDTAMQCDKLTGGGVLGNAFFHNTLVLTVGVNGGTSTFAGTLIDGGNYNGVTCSSLTLIKQGTEQLILTGANTHTGGTTISTGILQIGNGGNTGTPGTGAITNNSSLKINRYNEVVLSGIISGSGTLTQQGTGKTILSAANTYSGTTSVEAGELNISSSLNSAVTVKSGALLSSGANGTISNTVLVETGGRIQGGNGAPGTLTINGPLTLQNNVVLNVYSSNATVSKIVTPSTPVLGAMTVNLKTPMTAGTYTLLQAPGSGTAAITQGVNNSTLYCVNYSRETNTGLQVTANNNTAIDDAVLSSGTLSASSPVPSALLQPSQSGVTYTLYRTVNNTTSIAATQAGTGGTLTFDNLGAGVYTVKGSKDGCIRPMRESVDITIKNYIPEAVKVSLTGEAPKGRHTPYYLGELFPSFQANVIGDCSDPGYYYAGFQLSYDGSDQNTAADWAAQLSISLIKGTTTTKLTDSLKVDLGTQTFETTVFFRDSIRCADNYQFIINSKTVKGNVPAGAVHLFIHLYKVPGARPEMSPTASTNFTCTKENNTIKAAWLNSIPGVDEYDLEWTFIDHYDNYTSGNEAAFTFQEPVRVTVKELEYTHQVYYTGGKIYYRIRPVGHQKSNPAQRISGVWSYSNPIEITNHNTGQTWQQQTIFAEEGKYKKVMSYYDATGRLRQQQTNLSSENSTLTAETLYDFEGRKALTIMPAPERGNSLLYKGSLNPFAANSAVQNYTSPTQKKYHYDNERLANSLLDSTATGGAGRYYSTNNAITSLHRNHIPKAEGYAYTQTEYTRDGTGRISRQSGLGQELNIDGSHAMRYYYGSAAPDELQRLFGNKVGKAAHYKKDVAVDANGQATVTYKDQEGRTIATALAGAPPANVERLASYPAQAATVSLNLTEKNSKKNGVSETVHTFINTAPNSEMTINYTWSARGVQLPTGCTACGYRITLELTDPNGNKVNLGNISGDEDTCPSYRKTRTAASCAGSNASNTTQFTQVALAEIGDYTLRKTLTPTILSYEQVRESVKQQATTTLYRDSVRSARPATYESCEENLGNKDPLIEAAIREAAEKTCQRILDTIKSDYVKTHSGTTMPDDFLKNPQNHQLICKYNYCKNNIESTVFDSKLAMIENWTAAVSKSYGTASSLIVADPFFSGSANAGRRSSITQKMDQVSLQNFEYTVRGNSIINPVLTREAKPEQVTDPDNSTYFVNKAGTNSASGYHYLYYDLKEKRATNKITQTEYDKELSQRRWALFRYFYSEGKRQIKLGENADCDSMKAELRKQDRLPKTQEEILARISKEDNDSIKAVDARMTVIAFKSACAPNMTKAHSALITKMLYRYFKSTPYNYMGVIDEVDLAIDNGRSKNLHLDSVRVLLEGNYPCRLSDFATQNPFECLQDTTVYDDDALVVPPSPPVGWSSDSRSAPAPMAMSMRTTDERADGELRREEREMEEERNRRMEEEREARIEREREERVEEEKIGGKNAFMRMMASTTQPLTPVAEVNALIDFYNSTNGNQWSNTYRFWHPAKSGTMLHVTAPTNISNWYGVTLDAEGHVKELHLSYRNLIGTLPGSLSACTKLRLLSLSGQQLTGMEVLGQLPNLEELGLNFNQSSTGSLSSLATCTKLKTLNLMYSKFTGGLEALGHMPDLENVLLDHNQLSGSLSYLAICTKLKFLSSRFTQLTGGLEALGHMPDLNTLWLLSNQLSGSLSSLLSCTKLEYLLLYDNKFTFTDLQSLSGRYFSKGFYCSPQATVDTEQTIPFNPGTPITLTTAIDRTTTTPCKYQWFKKIGTAPEIKLNAEPATGQHTYIYTPTISDKGAEIYYKITNSNFPYLTLTSHVRKLKLANSHTYCLKYRLHPNAPAAKLWDFDTEAQKRKCRATQEAIAASVVDRLVNTYIDEKTSQLVLKSDSSCLNNAAETLGITYTNKEHHYTLYYYDQAGNLVQTVPPQGIQTAATGNPPHTLKTTYRYNAQNQVVQQTTPDAGTSHFYYNKKGQMRFSQNARQALESRYAYTKYDAQGRITETGEASSIDLTRIEESHYPEANRTDITYTHYDAPARRSPLNQKYLRSRVSYTETIEKTTTDTTRTYYSYDPHGSVNILLQKLPGLPPKTTHYRYDLVSGKVNYVFYQYKKPDQFVHRYTYDSDNRIREVFTSADRYVWHKDATYKYYLHGPLATTELGHWRNQSLNYTYTLQGWIKGVNTIVPTDNMVGQSVMSYQLGYYKNDYKPIGAAQNNVTLWTRAQENIAHQGMYNGNISWMETDLKLFKKPQAMLYKYDQLNRITKSRSLEFSNGNYAARTGDKKYDENYTYDANGNILTLKRHDDQAVLADDFNYSYYSNTNRLLRHKTTGGTYVYDAIGNLITDNNENLQIAWTPSGKVRSVTKPDTTIYFRYDATGNRIAKIVSTAAKNDTTIYVRDASGNVMSIYRNKVVSEVPIYGSSRIGEYSGKEKEGYQTFNLRKYELTNHLGNVLAVISDKVNLYSSGRKVNNRIVADSVRATVVSASDYYPFGLAMKGREFSSSTYRYGFNGKENDKEFGWQDYGMRMYMQRIGRFPSLDPKAGKYPSLSSYCYVANNPINAVDPDGMDIIFVVRGQEGQKNRTLLYRNGAAYWNDTGKKYDGHGANNTIFRVLKAYQVIEKSKDEVLKKQLHTLEGSTRHHFVEASSRATNAVYAYGVLEEGGKIGSRTEFDFSKKSKNDFKMSTGVTYSDLSMVSHELQHQYDNDIGNTKDFDGPHEGTNKDPSEIRAVKNENRARNIEGIPLRTKYGGKKIDSNKLKNSPNKKK